MVKKAISLEEHSIQKILDDGGLRFLNISNAASLLLNPPHKYIDCTDVHHTFTVAPESFVIVRVRVKTKPNQGRMKGSLSFAVEDRAGTIAYVTGFGYKFKMLYVNKVIHLKCKVTTYNSEIQLYSPEVIEDDAAGKIYPIYKTKKGVQSADIYAYINALAGDHFDETVEDIYVQIMNEDLIKEGLSMDTSLKELIFNMHWPKTIASGLNAIEQLRKVAALDILNKAKSKKKYVYNNDAIININPSHVDEIISGFPYELTGSQKRSVEDILFDLQQSYPMNRLLSGDVGYGKSSVIIATALAVNVTGSKVAIMTCNELLVDQLIEEFKTHQLTRPVIKASGTKKIKSIDDNPIIVGTTSLLTQLKKMDWLPNYLIVDEQEKFGQKQRDALRENFTNVLESTATCIPKTGALITHGLMDVSILDECPVDKTITTHVHTEQDKRDLMQSILETVNSGQQAAVIYPMLSNKKEDDIKKSLTAMYETWQKHLPGRVRMMHGKMSMAEKSEIVESMKNKEFDLLVSSIVIERGITLPSLTRILVVDAAALGASQLHQIRGRLARHGGHGNMHMLAESTHTKETFERLEMVSQYDNGFELAEMDMNTRGYGDILGDSSSQHGNSMNGIFTHFKLLPQDFKGLM